MVPVVADEPVGDRRLGRHGLQRRVGVGQRHGRVEPGIRDPGDPDAPVVVGHVLDQPVDGVPGVAALVDVFVASLVRIVRPHINERALAHIAAPHVLEGEYVSGLDQVRVEHQGHAVTLLTARLYVIGRAPQQDRVRPSRVFRHVKRREQADAVPHRDVDLALGHALTRPLGAPPRSRR